MTTTLFRTPGVMLIWCDGCGRRAPHYGRGLCVECYRHWQERTRKSRRPRKQRPVCHQCLTRRARWACGLCGRCRGDDRTPPPPAPVFLRPTPTVPEPTDALPGTPEKRAVLAARFAAGQYLFHKDDAGMAEMRERVFGRGCSATRELAVLRG